MRKVATVASLTILLVLSAAAAPWTALGGDQPPAERKRAWTFDEVMRGLHRSPRDPYLQYLAIQIGRRENRLAEAQNFLRGGRFPRGMGRRERVDLFNTFTGALAVQESLQLDTMLGDAMDDNGPRQSLFAPGLPGAGQPSARPAADPNQRVALSSLPGPTIKSHPWEQMLGGRKVDIGVLANCVPDDFYLVEFKSAAKLTQALENATLWGDHLITQMLGKTDSQESEKRIKKQLGIQGIPPALFDTVGLEGIAVTGSDLYLGDGSDITLIVLGKRIVGLRQAFEGGIRNIGPAKAEAGEIRGVKFTHVYNDDRSVNVYSADPRPDLHVRSNSRRAFERVLQAINGQTPRLGDTKEFAYIRTLLPRGDSEEDGLIYLSDPCIRQLVGPRVKLTQQRRLQAFNHLKMIEHAALMFRTEHGRAPKSFEELAQTGCAPGVFGKDKLACPGGGTYTLAPDGMSAVSSIYGRAGQMTPLLDLDLKEVNRREADAYQQFLQEYNQYWRTYFDPIAVRVQVTPKQCRLETIVLPLIDNSIYTSLAQTLGGSPVLLDAMPVPDRSIHSVAVHINKKPLLDQLRAELPVAENEAPDQPGADRAAGYPATRSMREILIAMHNYHADYNKMPPRAIFSSDKKPLLSWRVQLLPYLELDSLYKQFKLDEPWDSEHNKKLIARIPPIYQSGGELNRAGKTRYVVPVGKGTIFPPDGKRLTLAQITAKDGTSNTAALLQASNDQAVIWTMPDDYAYDEKDPAKGLFHENGAYLTAFADGSLRRISTTATSKQFANVLTYNDDQADLPPFQDVAGPGTVQVGRLPSELLGIDPRKVLRFLTDGLGDQISVHVLDSSFPFNSGLSGFFTTESPLAELGPMRFDLAEMASLGLFIQSLTHPACAMIQVKDPKIVDDFLEELDRRFANDWTGDQWFIKTEQYKVKLGDKQVRVVAIKVLGLALRVCWCRMGDVVVVANQVQVLQDLDAQLKQHPRGKPGEVCHAMFRVRPENWRTVLADYNLGWEEQYRAACQVNQQRVVAIARAWPELVNADGTAKPELIEKVFAVYGVIPACPDGGSYRVHQQVCECDQHGTPATPTQRLAPADSSATAKALRAFAGLRASLTFREDGLHAVVTIERK